MVLSDWELPHTLPQQFQLERTEEESRGWGDKERMEADEGVFQGIARTPGGRKTGNRITDVRGTLSRAGDVLRKASRGTRGAAV